MIVKKFNLPLKALKGNFPNRSNGVGIYWVHEHSCSQGLGAASEGLVQGITIQNLWCPKLGLFYLCHRFNLRELLYVLSAMNFILLILDHYISCNMSWNFMFSFNSLIFISCIFNLILCFLCLHLHYQFIVWNKERSIANLYETSFQIDIYPLNNPQIPFHSKLIWLCVFLMSGSVLQNVLLHVLSK